MNKYQEIRKRLKFESLGGSEKMFWIKAQHQDAGEIRCISNNIKARAFVEAVDKGKFIADLNYNKYVTALWDEVCTKSNLPTTLPLVVKSIRDLAYAMNNRIAFDYMDLLKRGFIVDIADPTSTFICKRGKQMIVRKKEGKFIVAPYDEGRIAKHLKKCLGRHVS